MLARGFGRALAPLIIGAAATLAATGTAHANPRPLPYTYIYETLPQGDAEIEQYADLTPLRVISPNGAPVWYLASQFQTEIEVGLTDRLELGLYLMMAVTNAGFMDVPNMPEGTGVKQGCAIASRTPDNGRSICRSTARPPRTSARSSSR